MRLGYFGSGRKQEICADSAEGASKLVLMDDKKRIMQILGTEIPILVK